MRFLRYILTLLVIIVFLSSVYWIQKAILIKEISCSSQFGACRSEIEELLASYANDDLLSLKRNINNGLKDNSMVKQSSLHFLFPNKLKVNILERKPNYAVYYKVNKVYALVDEDGSVLSFTENSSLPKASVEAKAPGVGETLDSKLLFSLEIVEKIQKSSKVEAAVVENQSLVMSFKNSPKAVFPLEGDIDVLVGSYMLITSGLNSGSEEFRIDTDLNSKTLDLRFKNPVVR